MYVTQEFIKNGIVDPSTSSGQMEVLWANGHFRSSWAVYLESKG